MPVITNLFSLLIILSIILSVFSEDDGDIEFVPTHEWQEVQSSQKLPPGLHYKIDFESGKKFAKLIDEGDSRNNEQQLQFVNNNLEENIGVELENTVNNKIEHNGKPERYDENDLETTDNDSEELKYRKMQDILLKLPHPDPELDGLSKYSPEQIKDILDRIWAKRQKELKEAMASQVSDFTTMANYITILLNESSTTDQIKQSLLDLEYYLEDYDNAQDFQKLESLDVLIYYLNSTNEIRQLVFQVLGTLFKSNFNIHTDAIKYDIFSRCYREFSVPNNTDVILKSLYTINCLIQNINTSYIFSQRDGPKILYQYLQGVGINHIKTKIYVIYILFFGHITNTNSISTVDNSLVMDICEYATRDYINTDSRIGNYLGYKGNIIELLLNLYKYKGSCLKISRDNPQFFDIVVKDHHEFSSLFSDEDFVLQSYNDIIQKLSKND